MATGKAAQIPDALLARFLTLVVGSPALPLAYPDIAFDPAVSATDGKYLEASFFANRPKWEGVRSGVMDQGLFQVMVHWPRNAGIIAPSEAAELVKAHFAKGTSLTSGSTTVKLTREPWAGSPLIGDHEVMIPVTVAWLAAS